MPANRAVPSMFVLGLLGAAVAEPVREIESEINPAVAAVFPLPPEVRFTQRGRRSGGLRHHRERGARTPSLPQHAGRMGLFAWRGEALFRRYRHSQRRRRLHAATLFVSGCRQGQSDRHGRTVFRHLGVLQQLPDGRGFYHEGDARHSGYPADASLPPTTPRV